VAASAGNGRLLGVSRASGVANRARCWLCGSTTGPFAEPDWLFRVTICVGCQGHSRSTPEMAGQVRLSLPPTVPSEQS
jgi:hypothetical protein